MYKDCLLCNEVNGLSTYIGPGNLNNCWETRSAPLYSNNIYYPSMLCPTGHWNSLTPESPCVINSVNDEAYRINLDKTIAFCNLGYNL